MSLLSSYEITLPPIGLINIFQAIEYLILSLFFSNHTAFSVSIFQPPNAGKVPGFFPTFNGRFPVAWVIVKMYNVFVAYFAHGKVNLTGLTVLYLSCFFRDLISVAVNSCKKMCKKDDIYVIQCKVINESTLLILIKL